MVKRWEKMGRKPILRLGENSKSANCQPANSSSAVFRGLTQYADSDDDDDEGNDRHVSSVGEPKKIDLEVADFLKEIDALAPNELPESSEAEAKDNLEVKNEASAGPVDLTGDLSSSSSLTSGLQCPWQQCYDEQTGYAYFWNVQTNEVTWETPEDVKRLVDPSATTSTGAAASEERSEQTNGIVKVITMMPEDLSHHQPPKKRRKNRAREADNHGLPAGEADEGKIIPITSYGPSSSDDEATPEVAVAIPKKRRLLASQHRKVKDTMPSAEIGPHLPLEVNGFSEVSQTVSEAILVVSAARGESSVENATLDSSTVESGDLTDSPLVSTCSATVPFEEDRANSYSDHGEAMASRDSDPCCSRQYGPSLSDSDQPPVGSASENQQPDSISASGSSPQASLPDDDLTSFSAEVAASMGSDCEMLEGPKDGRTLTEELIDLSAGPVSSQDLDDGGGISYCKEESSDGEQLKTEPDSTTRKEGKRSHSARHSEKKGAESEAIQRLLQYEETDNQADEAGPVRHTISEAPCDGRQEVSSADSPPELPAPSSESAAVAKCNRIRFVKSDEVLDLNRLISIPSSGDGETQDTAALSPAAKEEDLASVEALSADEPLVAIRSQSISKPEAVREDEDKVSLPDDELDLEEIERALDSALERNMTASTPSTSKSQASSVARDRSNETSSFPAPSVSDSQNDELTVEDLSSLLFSKLAVLGMGKMDFSALALLHVQLETRYTDWQLGQLSLTYLMERLKEADVLLKQYESKATPSGWTCNWDRENGRYFYTCNRTGRAQWEFPSPSVDDEEASSSQQSTSFRRSPMQHPSTAGQHPLVTSSTAEELFRFASAKGTRNLVQVVHPPPAITQPTTTPAEIESWPTPPPGSPPAPPVPPKSPPPPPPDSTEAEGSRAPDVDMDIEDGNSKESADDPSSSSVVETSSFRPVANIQFLEREQSAFYEALGHSWLPEGAPATAGVPLEPVAIVTAGAPSVSMVSTSEVRPYDLTTNCYAWAQPAAYSGGTFSEVNGCDPGPSGSGATTSNNCYVDPNFSEPGTSGGAGSFAAQESVAGSSGIVTKKERKKSKLATGLALKKKKISSLVEKWQKIKKEQLREELLTINGDQKKTSDQDEKISTTM